MFLISFMVRITRITQEFIEMEKCWQCQYYLMCILAYL